MLLPFSLLQKSGPPVLLLDVYIPTPLPGDYSAQAGPCYSFTLIAEIPGGKPSDSIHNLFSLDILENKLWLLALHIASIIACSPTDNPAILYMARKRSLNVDLTLANCRLAYMEHPKDTQAWTAPTASVTLHQSWLSYFLRRAPTLLNFTRYSRRIVGRCSLRIAFSNNLKTFVGLTGVWEAGDHVRDSDVEAGVADAKPVLWLPANDPAAFLKATWC